MNTMVRIVRRLQEIQSNSCVIIGLFLIVNFSSCNGKKQFFLLPNGDKIGVVTINELGNSYTIRYQQYLGFTSKYNDTFLKEVLFLPQNYEMIGSDVLNDRQIAELRSKKVKLIKFNYILKGSRVSRKLFEEYVLKKYGNLTQERVDSNYFILTDTEGNRVCDVKYFDFGVPGYWLTVYPN